MDKYEVLSRAWIDCDPNRAGRPWLMGLSTCAPWEFEREIDAHGEWFGDDWCFGWPTHWMPMPSAPIEFADAQARFQKEDRT